MAFHTRHDPAGRVAAVHAASQHVVLSWQDPLPDTLPGEVAHLSMEFIFPLAEGLDGLYKTSYTDSKGASHTVVSTQFEPIAARKAFPCFDEPRLKATFSVQVVVPAAPVVALSNMPGTAETTDDGRCVCV